MSHLTATIVATETQTYHSVLGQSCKCVILGFLKISVYRKVLTHCLELWHLKLYPWIMSWLVDYIYRKICLNFPLYEVFQSLLSQSHGKNLHYWAGIPVALEIQWKLLKLKICLMASKKGLVPVKELRVIRLFNMYTTCSFTGDVCQDYHYS